MNTELLEISAELDAIAEARGIKWGPAELWNAPQYTRKGDGNMGAPRRKTVKTAKPASESQISYIKSLISERDVTSVDIPEDLSTLTGGFNGTATVLIDKLKKCATREAVSQVRECVKRGPAVPIEDGMYLVGGVVYKVIHAIHGSGRQYAKRLGEAGFVYQHGAMALIRPEHRMTLEQAKAYGQVYGVCCVCGTPLTNEASIVAGIGPVCAKRM